MQLFHELLIWSQYSRPHNSVIIIKVIYEKNFLSRITKADWIIRLRENEESVFLKALETCKFGEYNLEICGHRMKD